jgi:PAS domain S-box-containing protein
VGHGVLHQPDVARRLGQIYEGSIISGPAGGVSYFPRGATAGTVFLDAVRFLAETLSGATAAGLPGVLMKDAQMKDICAAAAGAMEAAGCRIRFSFDNARDAAPVCAAFGVDEAALDDFSRRRLDELSREAITRGEALVVNRPAGRPDDATQEYGRAWWKSLLVVPLAGGDGILGAMELFDKKTGGRGFTAADAERAGVLASVAALGAGRLAALNRSERDAARAEKRLEGVLNSSENAVMILDSDNIIKYANRPVGRWIGAPEGEKTPVGRLCLDVFTEDAFSPCRTAAKSLAAGRACTEVFRRAERVAEVCAHPVTATGECVITIKDTTDLTARRDEIVKLYRKAAETKVRLENLIGGSADGIVTLDADGKVTSWNKSAEKIFGYAGSEILGSFIPFLPNVTGENKKEFLELISKGETLHEIETRGYKKDGTATDISLTISPVKDIDDAVTSLNIIARDISRHKIMEDELIRSNQRLSHMIFISSAMRSTLSLDKLLRMILTAATVQDGLAFNRAVLFMHDERRAMLTGAMGVGPSSRQEAVKIWRNLSFERKSLPDILNEIEQGPLREDSEFDKLGAALEIPLAFDTYFSRAVAEKRPYNVRNARRDALSPAVVTNGLESDAYAVVPLIAKDKVVGVLWVDNLYNERPITGDDIEFLSNFADQAAAAVENARLFEQARMAENELSNIFESITDLVFITDTDRRVVKANKAVCELTDLPMERVIGRRCHEVFHGQDTLWAFCPNFHVSGRVKAAVSEVEGFLNGSAETYSVSMSPIFDSHDAVKGMVHIVSNVTEIKKLREQLARTEKVAALGEMAARVAHEIRTPLVSIGGFTRRLAEKIEPPLNEYTDIIIAEVGRLEALLRQTLGFVRESKMSKELVDVNTLLRYVVRLLRHSFRGEVLIEERLTTESLELLGDPNRLKEAFINLINNAHQSIEGMGRIIVGTRRQSNLAVIEIEDTGKGIDKAEMKYIFDPFFTTRMQGTGLGLAITRKVIEEHGGAIEVKSNVGAGTIFKINLLLKEVSNEGLNS